MSKNLESQPITSINQKEQLVVFVPSTMKITLVESADFIEKARLIKSEKDGVTKINPETYGQTLQNIAYAPTLAIPTRATLPRADRDGQITYDEHPESNRIIYSALKKLESSFGLVGLPIAFSYFPNGHIPEVTIDTLLEYAIDAHKKGDKKLADQLFYLALSVEKASSPSKKAETAPTPEVEAIEVFEKIRESLVSTHLSTGETFFENAENLAHKKAEQKINDSLQKIEQPITSVIERIKNSLQNTLVQKSLELSRSQNEERTKQLIIDIVAIKSNILYCDQLIETTITYDNYEEITKQITGDIQTRQAENSLQRDRYIESNFLIMKDYLFDPLSDISLTTEQKTNFENILLQLCTDGLLDHTETQFQSVSSLKTQLKEACRIRQNAILYIEGDPKIQTSGIRFGAQEKKLKEISEQIAENGNPIINILTAKKLSPWVIEILSQRGIVINSTEDLLHLYEEYTGDKRVTETEIQQIRKNKHRELYRNMSAHNRLSLLIAELQRLNPNIDINQFGFESFYEQTYVTGIYDTPEDDIKGEIMEILTPILDHYTSQDIRARYNQFIQEVSSESVDKSVLIDIEKSRQLEIINGQMRSLTWNVLKILSIPYESILDFAENNQEKINSILLSFYEISTKANDTHLNPTSVLRSITEAVFYDKPLNLQIVRCLRWCYPHGDVEIVPHASDWETHRPNGQPLLRKEWVEIEKLNIYNNAVVEPLKHHQIPIKSITLLATGDYEVSGEGYQFDPEHPQRQNALSYVADLKDRAKVWKNFGDTPIVVKSFKELIAEFGADEFQRILDHVTSKYNDLFQNYDLNYHGLTGKNIERIVDSEHGHRDPFISWWNRDRSYGFTRHKITYEMAFSVILALQENILMSASGNQYSGTNFSHGHRIIKELGLTNDRQVEAIGITFINSVNDGDQSAHFAAKTTVIQ